MLFDPVRLQPTMNLNHPKVPILGLLDAFEQRGFAGVRQKVEHTPGGSKLYDARRLSGKRFYFQCVLASEELWSRGAPVFNSLQPVSYYKLLLRWKRGSCLAPGKQAAAYAKELAKLEGDEVALTMLEARTPSAAEQPRAIAVRARSSALEFKCLVAGDSDSGGDGVVDDPAQPIPIAGDDVVIHPAPLPIPIAGDDVVDDPAQPIPIAGGDVVIDIPEFIEGCRVQKIKGRCDMTWSYNDRLKVVCPNRLHVNCSKSRSVLLMQAEVGPRAAECFLGAWLSRAYLDEDRQDHYAYKPNLADTLLYRDSHLVA